MTVHIFSCTAMRHMSFKVVLKCESLSFENCLSPVSCLHNGPQAMHMASILTVLYSQQKWYYRFRDNITICKVIYMYRFVSLLIVHVSETVNKLQVSCHLTPNLLVFKLLCVYRFYEIQKLT